MSTGAEPRGRSGADPSGAGQADTGRVGAGRAGAGPASSSVAAGTDRSRGRWAHAAWIAVRAGAGLAVPSALYYVLRGLGADVYWALVVSTLLCAVPALVSRRRRGRVDGLSTYFGAMMLGGLAVSLLPGNDRFLLAREAVLTGVTGAWFLVSALGARPLAYALSKPLLQGRLRWPGNWDRLWEASPRFRRMWRVSSLLWGLGLLADAGVRVALAYTVRPDLVPALAMGLSVVTLLVLNVVTNVHYVLCRVHDPRSPLRQGVPAGS